MHVRREDEGPIKELRAPMPNVDVSGIRSGRERGDIVELTYVDQNTRVEHQTGFMDPILPEDVEFATRMRSSASRSPTRRSGS